MVASFAFGPKLLRQLPKKLKQLHETESVPRAESTRQPTEMTASRL